MGKTCNTMSIRYIDTDDGFQEDNQLEKCPDCDGTGYNEDWNACRHCDGEGWLIVDKTREEEEEE